MRSGFRNLPTVLIAFSCVVFLQAAPPVRAPLNFTAIPRPPVPADVLELVSGNAQPVQDAQQRIAAIALLNKARDLSNVRAQPYNLKTTFSSPDGNWTLEDTAVGHAYRWTAQGPNYSAINLYPDSVEGGLYSNQPGGILPLRLLQVRSAMFFTHPMIGPQASIRTATATLNGVEQRCVLVVIGAGDRTFTGGRNWEESEYCVDANSGLLTLYSPAPALFIHYDYSAALRFHNKTIPNGFTISEAGQKVAEARTISVTDPTAAKDDALFKPGDLTALGAGRAMNPGANLPMIVPAPGRRFPTSTADAEMQIVELHGNLAGDGRLSEVKILASSDATLNQAALDQVNSMAQRLVQRQPGGTPQSRELILTLEFIAAR